MVTRDYIPERGDIVWLNFNPALGHEETGRRPAFVLSPKKYNGKTKMAVCCPITKSVKGYAFEVGVTIAELKCAVLVDHVKALDWSQRNCQLIAQASALELWDVQSKLLQLIKG